MERRQFLTSLLATAFSGNAAASLAKYGEPEKVNSLLPQFIRDWYGNIGFAVPELKTYLPTNVPGAIEELCWIGERVPQAVRHWESHAVEWPPPIYDGALVLVGRENLVELGVRPSGDDFEIVTRRPRKASEWDIQDGSIGAFLITLVLASIQYSKFSVRTTSDSLADLIGHDVPTFWTGGETDLWNTVWDGRVRFQFDRDNGRLLSRLKYSFGYTQYSVACRSEDDFAKLVGMGWERNPLGSD
ncbi:MAG: hypothetical protein Q7Q71_03505 [Verrucomicrobiota bacterium JB023]|nr:hypothetical protein [Verrucomicrobiota bacterium JB023]